jgi:hypothetical protein
MFNKKYSLPSLSSEIIKRIESYNLTVRQTYGLYIENVQRQIRNLNNNQEQILPFSEISFIQQSNYDNGSFEYKLHHDYSQQKKNPSISPFSGLSGLTHQQFISNFNPGVHSWDLAYDVDLSSRMVPLIDIDAQDHTNSCYYLNSYVLDFLRHGTESLLISENELDWNETFQLLNSFNYMLKSIKTSIASIVENETKTSTWNVVSFFKPLEKKFSELSEKFSTKYDITFV